MFGASLCGEAMFSISPDTISSIELLFHKNLTELDKLSRFLEVDPRGEVVVVWCTKGGVVLRMEAVFTVEEMFARVVEEGFLSAIAEAGITKEEAREGLIPNIEIPIRFPGAMGLVLGEGGEIDISGHQYIELGARRTEEVGGVAVEIGEGVDWEPSMRQKLDVRVEGMVGERLHIWLDHKSESGMGMDEMEPENEIKIWYEGGEDDIVQRIDAGDVSVTLPGTHLIGGVTTREGLFGIKMEGRIGELDFTVVAAREQGETEEKSFVKQAEIETLVIYDSEFIRYRFFIIDPTFQEGDSIIEIKVYRDDGISTNDIADGAVPAVAEYTDPFTGLGESESGNFHLELSGADEFYVINPATGVLELNTSIRKGEVLGVAYVIKRRGGDVDTVGDMHYTGDTLRLKLLKPRFPSPDRPTWWLEMKNVYSFGYRGTPLADFNVEIYMELPDTEDVNVVNGEPLISLLGLDQDGDLKIDPAFVDFNRGIFFFPSLYPFADTLLPDPDSIIYDTTDLGGDVGRKYYIKVWYASGIQQEISLGVMNILENSEVVVLNDSVLQRGEDYTIDYQLGTITFLTDAIYQEGAELDITYQYKPFLSLENKTFMGLQGKWDWEDLGYISTAWLYRSVESRERRPKIGEEPERILAGQINGKTKFDLPFLTYFLDALPLVSTEEPSSFDMSFEGGVSFPDPNAKGEGYIEDMESSEVSVPLGVSRSNWHLGSMPSGRDTSTLGTIHWYNTPRGVTLDSLYPDSMYGGLPEERRYERQTELALYFDPEDDGPSAWGSMLSLLSSSGVDISTYTHIEVWVRGDGGTLFVDLGQSIPEDAPRKTWDGKIVGVGVLDTEDKNGDRRLDEGEDTGLDGVAGRDGEHVEGDDGNDDYPQTEEISEDDYLKLNGTEGNQRLDTEDLDGDGLTTSADFYEYAIPLGESEYTHISRDNGWRLYRIPLSAFVRQEGLPDLRYVRYVRLWITGVETTSTFYLVDFKVVGNRWRLVSVADSNGDTISGVNVEIGVKNTEDDEDYIPPFDPGVNELGLPEKEQSLCVRYSLLPPGASIRLYEDFGRPMDIRVYGTLKWWFMADSSVDVALRFAVDSLNFYEYWVRGNGDWQEITLPVQDLVSVKRQKPQDVDYYVSGNYGIRGNPSFAQLQRLEVVIRNREEDEVQGEVLVNEVRVGDPDRRVGVSGKMSASLKLADLMRLSVSVVRNDVHFKQITRVHTWNESSKLNYVGGLSINLQSLFPKSWGLRIPVDLNYTRGENFPYYKVGSDIVLSAKERDSLSGYNEQIRGSVSFSCNPQDSVLRAIISPLSLSASGQRKQTYGPTSMDSVDTRSARGSYRVSPRIELQLWSGERLRLLPELVLNAGYTFDKERHYQLTEDTFALTRQEDYEGVEGNGSLSWPLLSFLSARANWGTRRDFELGDVLSPVSEVHFEEGGELSFSPPWRKWIVPRASVSVAYREDHSKEIRRSIAESARNASTTGAVSFSTSLDWGKIFVLISKLRNLSKEKEVIKGSPMWLLAQLEEFGDGMDMLTFSYSARRSSACDRFLGRPSLLYRLGWGLDPGVDIASPGVLDNSLNDNASISSGVSIGKISVDATISRNRRKSWHGTDFSWSEGYQLPSISVSLSEFELVEKLLPFAKNISPRGSYTYAMDFSGNGERDTISLGWSKSWSADVGGYLGSVQLSYRYNKSMGEHTRRGDIEVTEHEESFSHSVSGSYSFSAPTGIRIPGLGKVLRFKSQLTLRAELTYRQNLKLTVSEDVETHFPTETIARNTSEWRANLSGSYQFSRDITGGLRGSWREYYDRKSGQHIRTYEIGMNVDFNF